MPEIDTFATHEVLNQPPPLVDYNLFAGDRALGEAVEREGAGWAAGWLRRLGEDCGRASSFALGELANRHPPVLHSFDRFGRRRDEVEFHPAWHELMASLVANGLHTGPWAEPKPGAHVARAAGYMLHAQIEAGSLCPTTMTYGSVPALSRQPEIAKDWLPLLVSRRYDRRFRPASGKTGALVGMGMTEKQGGSDVRANTTHAQPVGAGGPAAEYRVTGHKWFFSAPMCDAFLVLAQAPGGLSCFFLPRFTPDGSLNAIHLQRLKEKVGNRSNASSEVEFHGAHAWLLGEEGRGVPTILEMGTYTRLDCALGTTGLMRQAVSQALHHARHRTVFQRHLVDQPLMANVLADLAIEAEAAMALVMRLARAFDAESDAGENAFRRLMTPVTKFWICKRGPVLAAEAMEVLGGNGYVEEALLGRIYREMPVNSIWEGAGNIICLDVLRAAERAPDGLAAVLGEIEAAKGGDKRLDRYTADLKAALADHANAEAGARRLTEGLALALQASLLVRFSAPAMADAFCAGRLEGHWSGAFGTLPAGIDARAIIDRAMPN
ncbi:MAG: isovaleryl-CoA dehydrogenase [Proteobacteria bacterium]|nr:isovaleryl-CoA dehydrogenase [Pseudomonadota bacterium]MBI3499286.1 isovaleryl-CoA dehydrogenase [Pseudomonadota bacterium]